MRIPSSCEKYFKTLPLKSRFRILIIVFDDIETNSKEPTLFKIHFRNKGR